MCDLPECDQGPGVAGVARENLVDRTCGSKEDKEKAEWHN
jgi:hypothetical protein